MTCSGCGTARYHEKKDEDRVGEKQGLNAVHLDNACPIFSQSSTAHSQQSFFRVCVRLQVRALKLLLTQSRKRPAVTWNGRKKHAEICKLLYIFSPMHLFISMSIFLLLCSAPSFCIPFHFLRDSGVLGAKRFAWSAINTSPAFPLHALLQSCGIDAKRKC